MVPSVSHSVTDGRETRVGVGVSPSFKGRQPGSPGPPCTVVEALRAMSQKVKVSLGSGVGGRREMESWG